MTVFQLVGTLDLTEEADGSELPVHMRNLCCGLGYNVRCQPDFMPFILDPQKPFMEDVSDTSQPARDLEMFEVGVEDRVGSGAEPSLRTQFNAGPPRN